MQKCDSEDIVLQDLGNGIAVLVPARIDRRRAVVPSRLGRAGRSGRGAVPVDDFVFASANVGRRVVCGVYSVLVRRDLVRQSLCPGRVRVAVDVGSGVCAERLRDAGFPDRADVVRFAVVVPGDDLDEVWFDLQCLQTKWSAFRQHF